MAVVPRDVTMASVRTLKRNKRNAHTHSKKQIRQIANSISRFGWTYPLLIDETREIIAGHGRLQAAELLRLRQVPVMILSGLSEAEKRALALADNKIPANAGWDRSVLASELGELATILPECDLAIDITGFEQAEVDTLLLDLDDPEQDPLDEIPPLARSPVSRSGDLLLLNQHRLLCGDAQRVLYLRKLLGAKRAAMCITDPPYNLHISSVQGRGSIKHRNFVQAAGEMSPAEFTAFLRAALTHAAAYSVSGAIHFVFMDWRHMSEILSAGSAVYSELKNVVVWVKTNAGQGSFYRSQHELIFVFKSGEAPHVNNIELGRFGRNRSNVWSYAGVNTFRGGRLDDLSAHPTAKPVGLVVDAMRDCSRRGDVILDPFMGAGTTIMAAERVGRRAYGLELDPLYVDAAVRRWQAFTGRDAILKATGQTFDELAAARINTEAGNG
jgi:DNA modification methylase